MAKKTIIALIDDLDGESLDDGAGRTLSFAFDGAEYEIDLSSEHISELETVLVPYIRAARRVVRARGGQRKSSTRASSSAADLQAIREWAAEHGYKVASRGRIAADVVEAYNNR